MRGLESVPTPRLEIPVYQLMAQRVAALRAHDALRFAFGLDTAFYPLQGQKAIEYDDGIHTKHCHIRYDHFFIASISLGERASGHWQW